MTSTLPRSFPPAQRMRAFAPSFFHGLNERLARLRASGVDLIRMDMGSPDFPPPPFVIEALERSAEQPDHHGYMPFGGLPHYRAAWAAFYQRRFGVSLNPQTEVNGLIGSKSGVFQLALAYVNPGDFVLVPDPGYATYTAGAEFAGGEVVSMPLLSSRGFLPDLNAIPPEVMERARLLWLNYPNNPTGAVAPLTFFGEAVELAQRHQLLLAHDAPYTEVTYGGYVAPSLLQVPGAREVAIEFHSLSKTANMGGWRAGVAVGNADVIRVLAALQSNIESGTFRPILDAAAAVLTADLGWMAERNEHYRQRRDVVVAGVRAAGLAAEIPAAAIYVWAQLPGQQADDEAYALALLEATGVSVTPGCVFGPSGRGFVRVSLCTPLDCAREAMARWEAWAGQGRGYPDI